MSSPNLISLSRTALQRAHSICHLAPALRISFRPLSSSPQSGLPAPASAKLPKVGNTTEQEQSVRDIWLSKVQTNMGFILSQPPPNPYSGRTVTVTRNLGDSLKALDGILARNKIKYELRSAERHEKKGAKRRRLASERWRNQFANEVRKNVQLVMKMRDRGA